MESSLSYIAFNEVGITVAGIGAMLAFVVLVWNAIKAIHDWRALAKKPTDDVIADHEQRISDLEDCCKEVKGKLASDFKFQREQAEVNKMVLKSLKSLLQHAVDGNDTKNLEQREQEIDKFLLDHMK